MEKKSSGSLLFHSSAIQIDTKMTCFSLCIFCSEYKKSCGFANSKSQDFSYSVTS